MLLGCIGDDFTGSSDLANTLAKQGMHTVQYSGIPTDNAGAGVEAGVIALKSRSIPVQEAIEQSLAALEWLQAQGCKQFFFKYCSTFDSTPEGNIGPVADALAERLNADCVIVCPAFPGTGRTLYMGHLFVNDVLLNESGLQNHPLNPMTDADIRRWLAQQSKRPVGHITAQDVEAGVERIQQQLQDEAAAGKRLIVVDAIHDKDLMTIGAAAIELPLITGGSGVALGLPDNFRRRGDIAETPASWSGEGGRCVALSGSCSVATRTQIAIHKENHPALEIGAGEVIRGTTTPQAVCQWIALQQGIPLVYSSAEPNVVVSVQKEFGIERSAQALEAFFAAVARQLVDSGVRRLISAGGETSGAVTEGLQIDTLEIGPEIDPGVPAMRASDNLVIALKSGNFGAPDFFTKAARILEHGQP